MILILVFCLAERYEKASKRLVEVGKDISSHNAKLSELESFQKLLDDRGRVVDGVR